MDLDETSIDDLLRAAAKTDDPAPVRGAHLPATIGRYQITGRLGAGGMGVVYAGHDPQLDRPVAIKVLRDRADQTSALAARLHREAQALARVTHPNVVSVYDAGVADGEVHIVMQRVQGTTLDRALAARPHTIEEIVRLFVEAGRGLAAAHAVGLVHRDFKPSNVLVDEAGQARITDFGLAVLASAAEPEVATSRAAAVDPVAERLTRTGAVLGTPAYMAPEQFTGGPVDARTDQFSYCVALWEALCGVRPFAAPSGDLAAVEAAVRGGQVQPPPAGRIPRSIERALRRGLSVAPAARFPSMAPLLAALEAAPARRRPGRRAVVAGGLLVVAAAGGGLALRGRATTASRAPAAIRRASVDAPSPKPLTSVDGCAANPAFLDEDTVVYEQASGKKLDLYTLELGGGAPTRITADLGVEAQPNPGVDRTEVVFAGQGVDEALDLVTEERRLLVQPSSAIASAGGAYYHAPRSSSALRRLRAGSDEIVWTFPGGRYVRDLTASRDGRRLGAVVTGDRGVAELCAIDLDPVAMTCWPLAVPGGRPAFSADGMALYAAGADGLDRWTIATGARERVAPSVAADGGVAVSPSGATLVYSACRSTRTVRDLVEAPDRPLVPEPDIEEVAVGPGGWMALVRARPGGSALVVRSPDGTLSEQVVGPAGSISQPAFDAHADWLAYVVTDGARSGLYIVRNVPGRGLPSRLTDDPTDAHPAFAGTDVVFTRWGADGEPRLGRIAADGLSEVVLGKRARITVGTDHVHGRVLLSDRERVELYWWDPRDGTEQAVRFRVSFEATDFALSPDGAWLLQLQYAGVLRARRLELAPPPGRRPVDEDLPLPRTLDRAVGLAGAIDERGHGIVVVPERAGELMRLDAPPGTTW